MNKTLNQLVALVAAIIVLASSAKAEDAPVYQNGYLTIHTQPEGAAIFVMENGLWKTLGYAPLTVQIPVLDGHVGNYLYFRAIPTAPGQFSQSWSIGSSTTYSGPGSITVLMYRN
jgi:hypothetical protein